VYVLVREKQCNMTLYLSFVFPVLLLYIWVVWTWHCNCMIMTRHIWWSICINVCNTRQMTIKKKHMSHKRKQYNSLYMYISSYIVLYKRAELARFIHLPYKL